MTTQEVRRKNDSAWRSFLVLLADPEEEPHLPGYWNNEDPGRQLPTYI